MALDFHASKYLVYPNSRIKFHDPENEKSPVHQYLKACAKYGDCIFDEQYVDIKSFDLLTKRMQTDDELVVQGELYWGRDVRTLMKYFGFRTGLYKLMV